MANDLRAPNPPWLDFISSSTAPPKNITAEEKLRNKLTFYSPLPLHRKRPDDTDAFLTKFLNLLPTTEGKDNLAYAAHLYAGDSELRDLADNLGDNILRPLKAKGGRPKQNGSTSSYSREALRFNCLKRDGNKCVISGL
ncbi:uncharacterized protein N7498_001831 [Penicillium cinerascens]|uniref:Uncharacterized protein n=1 Tax=Penicillium cinerascens TaxID=70096 RepID=A0A9W9NAL6_9EURO|nr:uncharacterized protein N7498_001831 [Penicillium cinerascens]KAJ5215424.1 hypothetical protein N7498_001831 [Penicillium cinerascens]